MRIVRGTGRLDGPGRVLVDGHADGPRWSARRGVVLNTGTSPGGATDRGTRGHALLDQPRGRPAHRAAREHGRHRGGPIGCELTQTFARFGVEVTLIESADRIMTPEEPETSAVIERVLVADGVGVHTGVDIVLVEHDGSFAVHLSDGRRLESAALLVSAGRQTNLDHVGLETVGLDPGVGVDRHRRADARR